MTIKRRDSAVLAYVIEHPGCTADDLAAVIPCVKHLTHPKQAIYQSTIRLRNAGRVESKGTPLRYTATVPPLCLPITTARLIAVICRTARDHLGADTLSQICGVQGVDEAIEALEIELESLDKALGRPPSLTGDRESGLTCDSSRADDEPCG